MEYLNSEDISILTILQIDQELLEGTLYTYDSHIKGSIQNELFLSNQTIESCHSFELPF